MGEDDLLERAAELPHARELAAGRFAPLVASPLLIRDVRGPGGAGGRRITAGVLGTHADARFALVVEQGDRTPSVRAFGDATACAHAFGAELARAARDGLSARPEPTLPTSLELVAAGAARLA